MLVVLSVPQVSEHGVGGVPCVRVHVAPPLLESLATVAVNGVAFNWDVAPTGMMPLLGDTVTVIANTVMAVEFDFVVSDTAVAVIETERLLATGIGGAV